MKPPLASVLDSRLWRAGELPQQSSESTARRCIPTGFDSLDNCLPEGGWPLGTITEILTNGAGMGELGLVAPALASLTEDTRWVAWITPPYIPYAPALEDRGLELSRVLCIGCDNPQCSPLDYLWAAEQLLRLPACGAVLLWIDGYPQQSRALRRLQVAAQIGGSWGVVFRSAASARHPSPAAVRLEMQAVSVHDQGTRVKVLKCRGRAPVDGVVVL